MKRIFLICTILLLSCEYVYSYDFIRAKNGKAYYADIKEITPDQVIFEVNDRKITLNKEDIVLIEHYEEGLEIFAEDYIKTIDESEIDENTAYKRGNSIYVPISNSRIVKRVGAWNLRKMLHEEGYWIMADTPESAHCILEYIFDDKGKDKAYFEIKTRSGKLLYRSKPVSASSFSPVWAGEESAEDLFKKQIPKARN